MVMSEFELGISDEHEGIILLDDDAPVGMPLADFMGDIVLEVDVLPNMARCLSMLGVAREVAALTGQPLKLPPTELAGRRARRSTARSSVAIDDPKLSARYAGDADPERQDRPGARLDAAAAASTPACGRSTTSSTSRTTSCSNGASRCTPSTTTCS